MKNFFIIISTILLSGRALAFPTSTCEFYGALHKRLAPEPHTCKDACQVIANKEVFGYQEAINCYNSFPLADSIRHETLDSLSKALEFYVFKDIIGKSPDDHIPSSFEIDAELEKISKYKFRTEFEFNSFLTGFFNTLHDGHTRYTSECYSRFVFQQPFSFFMDDFKFWIYPNEDHSDSLVDEWLNLNVNISNYHGSQVLKINGMEPMVYMMLYSHFYIGKSRDLNSRISLGLVRSFIDQGNLYLTQGLLASTNLVPLNSSVTYSLETPEGEIVEVVAPYLVKSPKGFNNSRSFYSEFCEPPVPTNKTSDQIEQEEQEVLNTHINNLINRFRLHRRDENEDEDNYLVQEIYEGTVLLAYKVGDETGVLVIPDFDLEDDELWYYDIQEVFESFDKFGVKKLILELSSNSGGLVSRGNDILYSLFPNATHFSYDMRSSELLRALSVSYPENFFSPTIYEKLDGTDYVENKAFVVQKPFLRGSSKLAYFTPRFKDYYSPGLDNIPVTFEPKNIAIVTNFVCYSTCALLVNSLQQQYNISAYTTGLSTSHTTSAASLSGGGFMTFEQLMSALDETNLLSHPRAPRPLPNHVSFSFIVREAYAHKPCNRPLEFTYIPAHHHLDTEYADLMNPARIWVEIAIRMNDTAVSNLRAVTESSSY